MNKLDLACMQDVVIAAISGCMNTSNPSVMLGVALVAKKACELELEIIVAAAVLSGNRNFEGRVHPLTRDNYLASPPLLVAYALGGRVITKIWVLLLRVIGLAGLVDDYRLELDVTTKKLRFFKYSDLML